MEHLQNYIEGAWVPNSSEDWIDVVNPATERVLASLPAGSDRDVSDAVEAAARAQQGWAALELEERLVFLRNAADALERHTTELAELECAEMGKPISVGELFVGSGIAALRGSVKDAEAFDFVEEVVNDEAGQTLVVHHPVGVVAQIVPWNFTVTSVLLAVGHLLAAGNTVIVKPSEKAPLSAVRMFEVLDFPPGVLNLILGDRRAGEPLAAHPGVALVHFTGSVEAGRSVGVAAARKLHRVVLELGGKDPVLIDRDVNPHEVAQAVAFGSFINTGQICTSMERIYVHQEVAEPFLEALVAAAGKYVPGNGADPGTKMGPLVDQRQRDIVHSHVVDAVAKGATLLCGGEISDGPGFLYPATVLTDVTSDMRIMTEETFGPVAPVQVVTSFDEAIQLASESDFGLAATVYSHDPDHIREAHSLPVGIVWINEWQGDGTGGFYEPAGISGLGATGGRAALDAATRPSVIRLSAISPRHTV